MSLNLIKWNALIRTFKSVCRRWVSPEVRDEAELIRQVRMFAFLFLLPPIATATALLSLPSGYPLSATLFSLSVALPILAASWLSLSGSSKVRNVVTVAGGAMLVLAASGSTMAAFTASVVVLAVCLFSIGQRQGDWLIWSVSAFGAIATFWTLFAYNAASIDILAFVAALPVVAMAAITLNFMRMELPSRSEAKVASPDFSKLAAIAHHTRSIVIQLRQNGVVINAGGQFADECLNTEDLLGRGLIDRVHITDRPVLLGWVGGLTASNGLDEVGVRLALASAGQSPNWTNCRLKKLTKDSVSLTISIVVDDTAPARQQGADVLAVGSLGHELRTPLTAIVGFSEMLRDGFCGPLTTSKQTEYLDLIHRSSRHLLQVSDAMLDWSQLESRMRNLQSRVFLPAETASLAIGIVSADAKAKGVELNFEPVCGMDEFCGDDRAFTQILVNLLSNAIKFVQADGLIRLVVDAEAGCLMITVEDNGLGMGSFDRSSIGMPFSQAQNTGAAPTSGAGLGLSIVRELARLHGGSMQIESRKGEGTKVKVALRSLQTHPSNFAGLRPAQQDEASRVIRILEERSHATHSKTA